MKIPIEEVKQDLANVKIELDAMKRIQVEAEFLSHRDDVDAPFYRSIAFKNGNYVASGERLWNKILEQYPELKS